MSYLGKTRAYRRFLEHQRRTEQLLVAGINGLDEARKPLEELVKRFESVKAPRGRVPSDYKPHIKKLGETDKGEIKLEIDDRAASFMKKAIEKQLADHKDLHYHHFSILTVSIWGSFETYIYMLFEELLKKQPRMLKTKENISYAEAFENRERIGLFLAEKVLEKLGHFNLEQSLDFIDGKINFTFSKKRKSNLKQIYLIRNIIAHNSGILRSGQEPMLPDGITTKGNELRISRTYLKRIHSTIRASVTLLEKHVEKKFYTRNT